MKSRVPLLLLLVLLVAVVWMFRTDTPYSIEAKDVPIKPGTDPGLKVYIDPVTGKPVEGPVEPGLEIPLIEDELNLSDEGLIIEDSPVSGEMVNLQGRFRHRCTADTGADGKHTIGCDHHKSTHKKNSDSEEE